MRKPSAHTVRLLCSQVAAHYKLSVAAWMAAERSAVAEPERAQTCYAAILRSLRPQ